MNVPTVKLIASTQWEESTVHEYIEKDERFKLFDPYDDFDGTKVVEYAGRTCYMSFEKPRPGGARAWMENILKAGHGSILEHHNFTFWIEGVSRTLTHELVRHRAGWAYSQLSQRFVDSKSVAMVIPPLISVLKDVEDGGEFAVAYVKAMELLNEVMHHAKDKYEVLQGILKDVHSEAKRKQINEAARCVLPNMTETKIVATVNARALRHFFQMRASEGADAEIRELALTMYDLVKERLEFMDFSVEVRNDKAFLTSLYHKV
jgi:thymidylate synthase (FAD)